MRKLSVMMGLLVLVMAVGVQAAWTTPQIEAYCGIPNFSSDLTFDKFDPSLGTLLGVKITLTAEVGGGKLIVDNDGEEASQSTVDFGATVTVSSVDVDIYPGLQIDHSTSGSLTLAADDGDGPVYSDAGPDAGFIIGGTSSQSDVENMAIITNYIGAGQTFDVTVSATETFVLGTFGGAQKQIDPQNAEGCVMVQYEYYVPEPATLAILGLGSLLLARRRR